MRISDWSSDVCSSDLLLDQFGLLAELQQVAAAGAQFARPHRLDQEIDDTDVQRGLADALVADHRHQHDRHVAVQQRARSEEHTYELPSLMRTQYAVFVLNNTLFLHDTTHLDS